MRATHASFNRTHVRRVLTAAIATLGVSIVSSHALADTTIEAGKVAVDGLSVENLKCTLDKGGFLAAVGVVGALAKRHTAIEACSKTSEPVRVSFVFAGGKTSKIKVISAADKKTGACVAKALAGADTSFAGNCEVTVFAGPAASAKEPAPDKTPPTDGTPAKPAEKPKDASRDKDSREAPPPSTKPAKDPADYVNVEHWNEFGVEKKGWSTWIPVGAVIANEQWEANDVTWYGATSTHKDQRVWGLWTNRSDLDDVASNNILAKLDDDLVGVEWQTLHTQPAEGDFTHFVIQKYFTDDYRYFRFVVKGTGGAWQVIGRFDNLMPDGAVVRWINQTKFSTPK